jgi:23S rRNA pseudouridine2605 synthase
LFRLNLVTQPPLNARQRLQPQIFCRARRNRYISAIVPPPKTKTAAEPAQKASHRIAKLLARAGIASRREIERMIADGRVALNGAVIDTPATVLASLEGVTVDGNPVSEAEPARLFLYNKPSGLLVTEHDPRGRPTIYDRLPKGLPRLVPVGRLDLNTEGLLLMTTDGELKRQLELPATGVQRAYRARAYGNVTQAQLEDLIEGVEIEGVRYGQIDANLERRTGANVWIEMILTEGKNREVRRVLEYLGLQVSRLIRTRYGPFVLGDLPVGAVGEVREHDIESFRKNPTRLDLPQPARSREGGGLKSVVERSAPVRARPAAAPARPARPAREPERPSREADARPQRPARPGKPAKAPRQRADGTLATPAKPAGAGRAARARAHRDAAGHQIAPAPARGGARPVKGPAGGRGKPSGGSRPPRVRK